MARSGFASKVPAGMLAAAIAIAAVSTARSDPAARPDRVEAAVAAPFVDVGIRPIAAARDFWQARVDRDRGDYLSRTRLASTIIAEAKETGDLAEYVEAETVVRDALRLDPVGDEALLALASARAANHDFATARKLAEQVHRRHPASSAAPVVIADANFELGNYELARRQLDDLVATLPAGPGIDGRLAREAAIEGRTDDAIAYAADAVLAASELDLRPSEAAFYRFQLAHFLYQAGRVEESLEVLDAGLAIDARHLPSLELRAQVLVSLGRLREAATAYETVLERTPAPDLHGALAKVYRALGRPAAADAQVERGLELGHELLGRYPAERRHLAGFFADVEPATALDAAIADFATRHDVGAYDTLAWAYYCNGRPGDAARYVDGALAQGTQDAVLLYHAGMIRAATGDRADAVELLSRALELNPRFDLEGAPRARATLARLVA